MGLWDRFLTALCGPKPPSTGPNVGPRRQATHAYEGGVAVLDSPAQPQNDEPIGLYRWWAPEGVSQTEPISPLRPELTTEARALEARLISLFDGRDLHMPPMPRVAERVLARLREKNATMQQLANDLSEDQVTAADVLRLANSVLYRGATNITTLQTAVTRLGTQVIRTLMLHQSLRALTFPKKSGAIHFAEMLWLRSLASGCIMRELAALVSLDQEDAFLLGLMHDIGNVIVLRTAYEQEHFSHQWLDPDAFEFICFETHQEFGEIIAQQWKLPADLTALVSKHHAFPTDDDPLRKQRLMLILTDMISQMLGHAPAAAYDLMNSRAVAELGLANATRFEECLLALPKQIEETFESFE